MPRVLVIGYGNPLRGDDGFGYRVAETLRDSISDPAVEVIAAQQLLPELMERVAAARTVLLVDAAVGPNPGAIRERRIGPPASAVRFTHDLTAEGLAAGAAALYGWTGDAALISVAGQDFSPGFGLSELLSQRLQTLVGFLLRAIASDCKLPLIRGEL